MNTVIVLTLCNRPDYTRRVLDALYCCDGISSFPVAMLCEPVNDEVIDLAAAFTRRPGIKAWAMIGTQRVGCNVNTYSALAYGFDHHERVVALEDDTVPGGDYLRFMDWGFGQCGDPRAVVHAVGLGHMAGPLGEHPRVVARERRANLLGYGHRQTDPPRPLRGAADAGSHPEHRRRRWDARTERRVAHRSPSESALD